MTAERQLESSLSQQESDGSKFREIVLYSAESENAAVLLDVGRNVQNYWKKCWNIGRIYGKIAQQSGAVMENRQQKRRKYADEKHIRRA